MTEDLQQRLRSTVFHFILSASRCAQLSRVKDAKADAESKACQKDLEITRLGEELRIRKFTVQRLEASAEEKLSYIRQLEKEKAALKKDADGRNEKMQSLSIECDRIQQECHRFHSQHLDRSKKVKWCSKKSHRQTMHSTESDCMPKHDGYSKREIETLLEQVNSLSNDKLTLSEERIRLSEHVNRLNLDLRDTRQAQVRLCIHACT